MYAEKMLKRFNMSDAKPVNIPLRGHFKLSKAHAPTTEYEKALMSKVPYASDLGNLMYTMGLHEARYWSSSGSCQ